MATVELREPVRLNLAQRLALAAYGVLMRLLQPWLRRKLMRRAKAEPGYAHAVPERFGHYGSVAAHEAIPALTTAAAAQARLVWVHAVSLGETRAAAVLISALHKALPGMRLLLTHSTATGRAEGQHLLHPGDLQAWLPWDTPTAVARFLTHFQPRVGVLMETEIWPHLVRGCAQAEVPLVLANARLNERSWRQAQRLAWLAQPAYAGLSAVYAQTADDARRLTALGAHVQGVWGNLKFDAQPDAQRCEAGRRLRQAWRRPVVMLASSREGEEVDFLKKIQSLALDRKQFSASDFDVSSVRWLVVPRHPQRFDEVAELIRQQGFAVARRSQGAMDASQAAEQGIEVQGARPPTVWLGDSLGEMDFYYSLADVALLGGSFQPMGGQNLIEAAACGCPLVLGPHTFNFADAAQAAIQAGAALRVADMNSAVDASVRWLQQPRVREAAAALAQGFVRGAQGAARSTAMAIAAWLNAGGSASG
jgi:3-deoxy-D-manno-octulosonic-acid transferase